MVITVTCPSCASSFPVDPAKIPQGGVSARCTGCKDVFRIEKPAEAEPLPVFETLAPPPLPDFPEPVSEEPEPAVQEPEPAVQEPEPAVEEPAAPALIDEPDSWVMENEELPEIEAEPLPEVPDVLPGLTNPTPVETPFADPFAEPAPFENSEPTVATPLPAPPVAEVRPPPVEDVAPAGAGAVQGFTFGKRDPTDKARRLARVLVSDMIMYNAERHQSALASGTLVQDFEDEIAKSWKEFVDQVGDELAAGPGRQFWTEALNDILAKGEQVF